LLTLLTQPPQLMPEIANVKCSISSPTFSKRTLRHAEINPLALHVANG
jgi:hypothetical protein